MVAIPTEPSGAGHGALAAPSSRHLQKAAFANPGSSPAGPVLAEPELAAQENLGGKQRCRKKEKRLFIPLIDLTGALESNKKEAF